MLYKYTWNHIKILATICECYDTRFTISENWVNLLQTHHDTTFPFTLWPLTSRNSTVIASSSICSPRVSNISTSLNCSIVVKLYKSNEVIIVCFQHRHNQDNRGSLEQLVCDECYPCVFEVKDDDSKHTQLLTVFKKVKSKTSQRINEILFESKKMGEENSIECIIFTGYGIGAAMASFMARETAKTQKKQQKHLKLDKPKIEVDCVTFELSSNDLGKDYWSDIDNIVDKYVDVQHHSKFGLPTINEEYSLDKEDIILVKDVEVQDENNICMEEYMKEIEKRIYTSC